MSKVTALSVVGALLIACGGSKKPAKDAELEGENVSDEQHQNEVDPFFEGEQNRGSENVDLDDESSDEEEEAGDEGDE